MNELTLTSPNVQSNETSAIPNEIPFSSVHLRSRGRTAYRGIEQLAEEIQDLGLIQPIVLRPVPDGYEVDAGGRRYSALKLLNTQTLFHATSCDPARPGFVLKDEKAVSPLKNLLTEIAENLNREDFHWTDLMKLLVKAWKLAQGEAHVNGETIIMRHFGAMLGVSYGRLQGAVLVYDEWLANPARFADCSSISAAYKKLLDDNRIAVEAEIAKRMKGGGQPGTNGTKNSVVSSTETVPGTAEETPVRPRHTVKIADYFENANGMDFLRRCSSGYFDHVITDPDYAIDRETLAAKGWSPDSSSIGVAQTSVEDSLSDLRVLISESFRVTKPHGFLIFFYDLDHHNTLQTWATDAGWRVQRWPLIWHKVDFRGNAAPSHNTCKNMEYAMLCRKPGAVLQKPQMSSIFSCSSEGAAKDFGHPFAKPRLLWKWLYQMCTTPGQTVLDPCMGSASACVSAIEVGLQPFGCEIQEQHFNRALINLKKAYGPDTDFI